MKSFNIPMLVLGGGGYTVRSELVAGPTDLSALKRVDFNNIPYNDFFEYYAPDFKLHLTPSPTQENHNKPEHLQAITTRILQNLKNLQGAPSVQMHPVPPDWALANPTTTETLEDSDPNQRHPSQQGGGTKVEKDVDFGAGSKSNGGNSSSSSSASSDMEISERE